MDPTAEVSMPLGRKKCQPARKDNSVERNGWFWALDLPREREHSYDTCTNQYMVYTL